MTYLTFYHRHWCSFDEKLPLSSLFLFTHFLWLYALIIVYFVNFFLQKSFFWGKRYILQTLFNHSLVLAHLSATTSKNPRRQSRRSLFAERRRTLKTISDVVLVIYHAIIPRCGLFGGITTCVGIRKHDELVSCKFEACHGLKLHCNVKLSSARVLVLALESSSTSTDINGPVKIVKVLFQHVSHCSWSMALREYSQLRPSGPPLLAPALRGHKRYYV